MPNSLELGLDRDDVTTAANDVADLVERPMKDVNSRAVMNGLNTTSALVGTHNVMLGASAFILSLGVAMSVDHEGKIPIEVVDAVEDALPILKATVERFEAAVKARKGGVN